MHRHQASRRPHAPGRFGLLLLTLLTFLTGTAPASAQEGGIEVFAAETLFDQEA